MLILYISNVVNGPRVLPYVSLMSAFMFAAASFGMAFGFVVPRSEYYGLPVFLLNTALSVGGAYLDIAYNVSAGAKLFICFLNPSIALTMGVLTIESYLYSNDGDMDYNFQNDNKEYPSLNSITGVMIASAAFFLLIVFGMPFDIIFKNKSFSTENYIAGRADEVKYPCDKEDPEEDSAKEKFLLQVKMFLYSTLERHTFVYH